MTDIPNNHAAETIYALASGHGKAGIAVIRSSGTYAFEGYKTLTNESQLTFRTALLRKLKRPVSRETLDSAVCILFNAPHSYTGEDTVEYHVHGGPAVIQGVLDVLSTLKHHRMAEPGEFTRRAFENEKMDLTEAEAVADLIHAETQAQKSQALIQMSGHLSDIYNKWRTSLTKILAYVEAELEFPDEDLPDDIMGNISPQIDSLRIDMEAHLNDNRRGERLRNGIHIAVIGAPNAGKSSLVNALANRDVAIVSDVAGTTRDIIEAHLDIGGYPVIISDTAGLRPEQLTNNNQDQIEAEGIKRALQRAHDADIRLLLYDGTEKTLDPHTQELETLDNTITIINKADCDITLSHPDGIPHISAKTNQGIDIILEQITLAIKALVGTDRGEAPVLTRARHRASITSTKESLDRAINAPLPELCAEDLRLAIRELGRVTGRVDVEDLLDVVFRDFCIGK